MWIGVVLLCVSPVDVKTCDVFVRTGGGFFSEEACFTTVGAEVQGMLNGRPLYTRFKCFQMDGTA